MSFSWKSRDGREQTEYESAIDDGYGQVDSGYIAMWRAKRYILEIPIPWILLISSWAIYKQPADAGTIILQAGGAIAACGGCFGIVVAAIGVFVKGDKEVLPIAPIAPVAPVAAVAPILPIAPIAPIVPTGVAPLPVQVVADKDNPIPVRESAEKKEKSE